MAYQAIDTDDNTAASDAATRTFTITVKRPTPAMPTTLSLTASEMPTEEEVLGRSLLGAPFRPNRLTSEHVRTGVSNFVCKPRLKWLSFRHKLILSLALALAISPVSFANGSGEDSDSDPIPEITMFGVLGPDVSTLDRGNEYTTFMEEKFGVDLSWIEVDSISRYDQQHLMLSSGDLPEVIWHGSFDLKEQSLLGEAGVLLPLNSYIERSPDILASFSYNSDYRSGITSRDGNIYTLPYFRWCQHCLMGHRLWVNEEWLQYLSIALLRRDISALEALARELDP